MGQRLDLHALLVEALGSNRVYFQPPPSVNLQYPCIVYVRDYAQTEFANDKPYKNTTRYQVTYMDKNPDSDVPKKIAELPRCLYDRFYALNNLNHDVFKIFF